MLNRFIFLQTLLFLCQGFAAPWDSMPGYIPNNKDHLQASDLLYKNQVLTPEQATALLASGTDISKVNPMPSNDYWKDTLGQKLSPQNYTLNLPASAEFTYLQDVDSVIGDYRFAVSYRDATGQSRMYNILLSRNSHNRLLRKALLEKIGYKIPALQYAPKLRVHFSGSFSKSLFTKALQSNAEGTASRWVVNVNDTESDYVDLQDAIIYSATYPTLNLSDGIMSSDYIFGRRIMNSLLVSYNLTDVPESVNSFNWQSGKVVENGIYLPYFYASAFSPSFQDAQWISRRISKLTRADFQEIVAAAKLPTEVGMLLLERLISRRNVLVQMTNITEAQQLPFNTQITSGTVLVDGKLIQQDWPGYAPRFAFGDPASPISSDEILAFLESRLFSTAINSLVGDFNTSVVNYNATNGLQTNVATHELQLYIDQLIKSLVTGKSSSTPFATYKYPILTGNLILSREVVFGSYMGSDNSIQIADTFGVQINPGYYIGFDGLPSGWQAKGTFGFNIQRTYTHMTPVTSVVAANKMPFTNILVPFYQWQQAKAVDSSNTDQCAGMKDDSNQAMTDQVLCMAKKFKDELKIGESIIVTDSLVLGAGVNAVYPINASFMVQAGIGDSVTTLRRVQLLKKDDNTIQVYADPGIFNTFNASLGLAAGNPLYSVPLLTISFTGQIGVVNANFNKLDVTADSKQNKDLAANLKGIYSVLVHNSVEAIQAAHPPYQFNHHFSVDSTGLSFLFFQAMQQSTNDNITAINPDGVKQAYLSRSTGTRTGKDYQTLLINAVTEIIADKTNIGANVTIDATNNGNPASTIFGSAVSRQVNFQAMQTSGDSNSGIKEAFAQIMHTYRGWSLSRADADDILNGFNTNFGTALTWPTFLGDTTEIQLYMIVLKENIYDAGLNYMANLSDNQVRKALGDLALHVPSPSPYQERQGIAIEDAVYKKFRDLQDSYLQARAKGKGPLAADLATQMVDLAEVNLPGRKLINFVGGEKNITVQAFVQGFREGDETGTEDLTSALSSNTIGVPGSQKVDGPIMSLESNLGLSDGELFLRWIINPL